MLVDGSALVYRAFFALPPHLTTKDGIHTNAVFGFATMFKKLFAGKRPTLGAVVFDAPGKTTRDHKYPQYKAQRAPMPEDLIEQLPLIDRVVKAYRFPLLRVHGVEADDVIGTLAQQALAARHEVVIISSDKDFAQLVCERLWMHDTLKDVVYDRELVKKKWGVFPEQMVDYLALVGDAVDNIPGVDGIGDKGASQLLAEHGSLPALLALLANDVAAIKPRYAKLLAAGKDSALLSQDLATIDRKVSLPMGLADLAISMPDTAELNALFSSLEFYSLLTREQTAAARADTSVAGLVICATPADVVAVLPSLEGTLAIVPVIDGRYVHGALVGLALSAKAGVVAYVPLSPAVDDARLRVLLPLLQDAKHDKVVHDAKEAVVALARRAITLRGVSFDTRLASFLVDPNKLIAQDHSIEAVTKEYLHRTLPPRKELLGAGKAEKKLADIDVFMVAKHVAELAHAVRELAPVLGDLVRERGQHKVLADVELPLSLVLARMELDGIAVDGDELKKVGNELAVRRQALEQVIHRHAGKQFNVGSQKQLGKILFDVLKLPVIKRTKSGYSTDAEVLERLASKHEICGALLEYRRIDKLINTYTDVLQREVHEKSGRVHCCFQQTVGVTGRLITTDPDLQRTPTKTDDGKRIRDAFLAMPIDGAPAVMVDADWSQIELRLLAHVSGDPVLVAAYQSGRDIHKQTAAQVLGKAEEEITKRERDIGKLVNFSTIYGQGAAALAHIIGVKKSEAEAYIARYFELYAGVRRWLDQTIALADERGYAETLLGRRRIIPELSSRSPMDRAFGERVAANTPIQGSAADICKLAMLSIAKELPRVAPRSRMVLQVHDELLFECPLEEADDVMRLAKDKMEHVVQLRVPLVAEVGVGRSWGAAK